MDTSIATAYKIDLGIFNDEINKIVPKLNTYLEETIIKDRIQNLDCNKQPQESSSVIIQHLYNEKNNSILCVFLVLGDKGLKGIMLNELDEKNYDVNKIYFNEGTDNFENVKKLIFLYIQNNNLVITDEKYISHVHNNICSSINIPLNYKIRHKELSEIDIKNLKSIEIGNNYNGDLIKNSDLLSLNKNLTKQINKRTTNRPTIKDEISLENAFELILTLKVKRNYKKRIEELKKTISLIENEKIVLTIGDKKIIGNELISKQRINLINAEGLYSLESINDEMKLFLSTLKEE